MEGDRNQWFFAAGRYFRARIAANRSKPKDGARDRIIQTATAYGVDWFTMRLVLSADIPDGLHAVKRYSLGELIQAHASLDALEGMRELQRQRSERDQRHKKAARGGR